MIPVNLVSDSFRWMEDGSGTWLCVKAPRRQAEQICRDAKDGKQYDVKITEHRNRRSLDANAYFWVLAGKLAAKLNISPNEIYRQYIPDIADNYTIVPVKEKLLKQWDHIWCAGHIGRMTEDMGPCRNIPGYHNVMSFFGSSDYDTKQMSRLIDLIVQDCKAQGVETLTPRELDAMKSRWGEVHGK